HENHRFVDNFLDNPIADSNVKYCTAPLETKEGQDDGWPGWRCFGGGPAMFMEVPFPGVSLPCCIIRRHVPGSLPDRHKKSYFLGPVGKGNPDTPSVLRRASCGARPDYPGAAPTDRFSSRQFLGLVPIRFSSLSLAYAHAKRGRPE